MPLKSRLSIGCLYSLIIGILRDAQNLVIVLIARCLGFLLRILELLLNLESGGVDGGSRAVIRDSLLPLLQILVHLAPLHKRFGVLWLHLEAQVERRKCLLVFAKFHLADSLVQA